MDKGLQVLRVTGPGAACHSVGEQGSEVLVRDPAFRLTRHSLQQGAVCRGGGAGPSLVFVLGGRGELVSRGLPAVEVAAGQTWLAPAGLGSWELSATGPGLIVFVTDVPSPPGREAPGRA